jgi:RimJ/RimL family protein N-acetyltransferase
VVFDDWELTDGVISIRPPRSRDAAVLIAGRDAEAVRWLGTGSESPAPTACVIVDEQVVGWVDYDTDRDWLRPGEINVGYNVFVSHRGHGYAVRAVALLLQHLAADGDHHIATLTIDRDNHASLAVARKAAFELIAESDHNLRFARRFRDVASG